MGLVPVLPHRDHAPAAETAPTWWEYLRYPATLFRRLAGGFDDSPPPPAHPVIVVQRRVIPIRESAGPRRVAMDTMRPYDLDVEVFHRGSRMIIRADMPDFAASDVKVELVRGVLLIAGDRRHGPAAGRGSGKWRPAFRERIPLPQGTDPRMCTASFRDGVLEVAVPLPVGTLPVPGRIALA